MLEIKNTWSFKAISWLQEVGVSGTDTTKDKSNVESCAKIRGIAQV